MNLSQHWPYLEEVATTRLKNNQTERHVADYGTYIELIGAAGELAARRFLQVSEELHTHFDGGADIVFKDIRIDVKATVWKTHLLRRYLQWRETKPIKSDVILLTAVNIDRMEAILVGFALPHDIQSAPINRTRDYPCHEIPITRLRKASELLNANTVYDLYPWLRTQTQTHRGQLDYSPG